MIHVIHELSALYFSSLVEWSFHVKYDQFFLDLHRLFLSWWDHFLSLTYVLFRSLSPSNSKIFHQKLYYLSVNPFVFVGKCTGLGILPVTGVVIVSFSSFIPQASQGALGVKSSPANAGRWDAGLWRSSEVGNGTPSHYSHLENSIRSGDWWAIVHWAAKSWTQLNK